MRVPMVPLDNITELQPLLPSDSAEQARWEHTRLRRRILYGTWREDLNARLRRAVGNIRREAWGDADLSANPFRAICSQVAVLYDRAPAVQHAEAAAGDTMRAALDAAGAWSLLARVQRDTIGMREMVVRVDVANGELLLRPVPPDMVVATPSPDAPDVPVEIRELRPRIVDGRRTWTWDILSVADPKHPVYKVCIAGYTGGVGEDVTADVLGSAMSGEAYPYRDAKGSPILPYVLYHATRTGQLWDAWEGMEVVDGTLTVAVFWSMFGHVVRNASWPQRYAIGVEIPQSEITGTVDTARHELIADPAVMILLQQSSESSGQPLIGQFQPGADPTTLSEAIGAYERRLAAYAGVSASDIQRVSGDPRSGYALAISREGQREAARRMEPQFRRGDLQLIRVAACLLNRDSGAGLPESGWQIRYESVPPSADELSAQREQLTWEQKAGLLSPVDAWRRLHPGATKEEAEAAIVAQRVDVARLDLAARAALTAQGLQAEAKPEPASGVVITATQQIVVGVHAHQMPRESGRGMLINLVGLTEQQAEEVLGPPPEPKQQPPVMARVEDTEDERGNENGNGDAPDAASDDDTDAGEPAVGAVADE